MIPQKKENYKYFNTIFLSSIGGVLEFYDFVVFIVMSKFISQNFLTGSDYARLMGTYGIFALGSLIRPASGLILGHLGDRYGRKNIFLISILVMALATMSIGFIPGCASIGFFAPAILIAVRVIQGISLGGEVPGAITFVYEHMPREKKVFGVAILLASIAVGVALASLILSVISLFFSEMEISTWAWRLPFIIGGIGGLIGFIMRFKLKETPDFLSARENNRILKLPVMEIIRHYKCNSFVGLLLVINIGIVLVFFGDYLAPYLQTELGYSTAVSINLSLVYCLTEIVLMIIMGYLSLKLIIPSHNSFFINMTVITGILVLLTICNLIMISDLRLLIVLEIIASAFTSMVYLLVVMRLMDFFPTEIRYTGIAMTYNIGFGIAEAATPVVFTWTIHAFNSQFASVYCFAAVFAAGVITSLFIPFCTIVKKNMAGSLS